MRITVPLGLALAAATASMAACDARATAVRPPSDMVRMDPLPVYAHWWEQTKTCSGLEGDLHDIEWFVVPDVASIHVDGRDASGVWLGDTIVLAGAYVRDGRIVRHEMLHALRAEPGHPRDEFIGRCGAVVSCGPGCWETPTGSVASSGERLVTAAELEYTVSSWPAQPGAGTMGGYLGITLTVRNPLEERVVVDPASFTKLLQYRYAGASDAAEDGLAIYAPELVTFEAGETRAAVYDFWIGGAPDLPNTVRPGAYDFGAAYAGRWSAPLRLEIAP